MKIAYVLLENFAASIEISARPELAGRPLVVGGAPSERKTVYDVSPQAAAYGVSIGMTLRQAHQLCPPAVFVESDYAGYAAAFEDVLHVLDSFSPNVEVDGPGKAFVDLTGADRAYGGDERMLGALGGEVSRRVGIVPRIGMAANKPTARLAAHLSRGEPAIIPAGEEAGLISSLPTACLPCSDDTKRSLRFFGIRTIGQVLNFPLEALTAQFGKEGDMIYRFVRCAEREPVIPRPRPKVLRAQTCFDDPIGNSVYLLAVLGELIDGLAAKLQSDCVRQSKS